MYKLIRFYNQNRRKIWLAILVIALVIIIIQSLNYFAKNSKNKADSNSKEITSSYADTAKELVSDKSSVTGKEVSKDQLKDATDTIKQFMEYCNEQKIEEAYNLLSEDCKEVMFPSVQDFINIYYSVVFNNEQKIYTIENWIKNTYKIQINEDLSVSEGIDTNSFQDYITIVKDENNEYKLNVNRFIGRKEIGKAQETEKIKVTVKSVDIYMDYSVYSFKIENNSYRTILLDDLTNIDAMYIEDTDNVKYSAYTHELSLESLKLGVDQNKELKIKYYSKYSSDKKIKNIVFSEVISSFERYDSLKYREQYGKFLTLKIGV